MMELSVKFFEGAPKVSLGELIELVTTTNSDNLYGSDKVRGVSNTKEIQRTKANIEGRNLSKFIILNKGEFVFNRRTTRNGERLGLGFNDKDSPFLFTEDYVAFKVVDANKLDPHFLYLLFKRDEFDRYVRYNSWGSATEFFNWEDMQLTPIPLPSIEVQREYVAAYKSLQQLAEQNEALAEPLQKACEGFLSDVTTKYPKVELGGLISEFSEKNTDKAISVVKSVSVSKEFKDTNAKVNKNELGGYKIVPPMYISYVQTTKNEKCFASAINKFGYPIVVTSINRVITSNDSNILDNEFLAMWFRTPEFSRWAIYNSWGSAREIFDFEDLKKSMIPLPPIEVQQSIVALYHCAEEARGIASEAREQLKKLAPAMVQRAANTPVEV